MMDLVEGNVFVLFPFIKKEVIFKKNYKPQTKARFHVALKDVLNTNQLLVVHYSKKKK